MVGNTRSVLWVDLYPPKRFVQVLTPVPISVTFFGNRDFFKCNQFKMRSLGWVLIWYDCCPYKKRKTGAKTDTQGEGHATTEAETRVIGLQAKEN